MKSMGVPTKVIQDFQPYLSNMLGIIRGNVYYNLVNWYRLLTCIPVGDTSQFMETMMGVKQVKLQCDMIVVEVTCKVFVSRNFMQILKHSWEQSRVLHHDTATGLVSLSFCLYSIGVCVLL